MAGNDSSGIANRLAEVVDARNITQGDLAEAVEKTQAAVSQWIKGTKTPNRENLRRLAEALDVDVSWLEFGEGPGPELHLDKQRNEYTAEAGWQFRREAPDGGRDFGNANIWVFDPTVDAFVREVLQNSLDARRGERVDVVFRLVHLSGEPLEEFLRALKFEEQLLPHLKASSRNQQKFGRALRAGLKALDQNELLLCVIEDTGASGLLGEEFGVGNFAALARNNLDSAKLDASAGGSYGLGSAALWRMSELATVLFCSDLAEATEDGRRDLRIIGRSELAWHEFDDEQQAFAGPGWFGKVEDGKQRVVSYWENRALARDLRLGRPPARTGTSVCVLGFHDPTAEKSPAPSELAQAIESAAAKWFWPAMAAGQLGVTVETETSGARIGRREVVVDVEEREPQFFDALLKHEVDQVNDRLVQEGDVARVTVPLELPERTADEEPHRALTHEATLLVRRAADEDDSTNVGHLAVFRGPGMVIRYLDASRVCTGARPFHGALLCGKAATNTTDAVAAETFLRGAEPPAHDDWRLTPELKRDYKLGAGAAIGRLFDEAKNAIRDLVKPVPEDLSDGPQNLKELFKIAGDPGGTDKGPKITRPNAFVDDDGRWNVEATVTLPADDRGWLLLPVVIFDAETGAGRAVPWLGDLEPLEKCQLSDDGRLTIAAGVRSVKFRGVTDAARHPLPAESATISVDVRRVDRTAVKTE